MTSYVATINVPGYLPMDDDPPTFDTPREAWAYLAEERARAEDDAPYDRDGEPGYSATVNTMESLGDGTLNLDEAGNPDGTGSVHGDTPGYDGDHDLGLVYSVSEVEEEKTYSIIRFARDVGRKVVKTGLTLDEAREHCNDPATRGEGWFDGYEEE